MDIEVAPEGSLEVLSQLEVNALRSKGEGGLYPLLGRQVHEGMGALLGCPSRARRRWPSSTAR